MLTFVGGPSLLDEGAVQVSAEFDPEALASVPAERFGVHLPAALERAVPTRRAEYVAGRCCAMRALRQLAPDVVTQIGSAADRTPCWPATVVGSITHTAGFASAVVALAAQARGIGIDTEQIVSPERARMLRRFVAVDDELDTFDPVLDDPTYVTFLFSAKESLFKCLYPVTQTPFYFEHAHVKLSTTPGRFRATLLVDLAGDVRSGLTLQGRYAIEGPHVHTAVLYAHT